MPRIPLISADGDLTSEQRRVVDGILGRRGGRIPGPYRFSLHCPELTEAWHPLGEILRLKSGFPLRLSELAIIITAREWDCDYVFHAHAKYALQGGVSRAVVDAIAANTRPAFDKEDEEALYDYCTELFRNHAISDKNYERAKKLFGVPGIVELTALTGYYGMVAMTILAHEMPLPDGVSAPLVKRV
jgi:4-carboxymuconolactone decarboxylase